MSEGIITGNGAPASEAEGVPEAETLTEKVEGALPVATPEQLAEQTRFKFREQTVPIPEIGLSVVLKSLSVAERERMPDVQEIMETDDKGERTQKSMEAAAQIFSVVVVQPQVTKEGALAFLPTWPAEAFDRVFAVYRSMIGNVEEAAAATAEFPGSE